MTSPLQFIDFAVGAALVFVTLFGIAGFARDKDAPPGACMLLGLCAICGVRLVLVGSHGGY